MKNIHILPTNNPSRLVKQKYDALDRLCLADMVTKRAEYKRFNIYITSNEEIKEGDWNLPPSNIPVKHQGAKFKGDDPLKCWKKIILTTNQDLINDGVQAIDDEFLEWLVKNPSCEGVNVEKVYIMDSITPKNLIEYKILIPKEEPKCFDCKGTISKEGVCFCNGEFISSKQEWNPTQGEEVWVKVFSNWSKGTYIWYDKAKHTHIVIEEEKGGGHLFLSAEVLPYYAMPNEPKQETAERMISKEAHEDNLNMQKCSNAGFLSKIKELEEQIKRMYSEEEVRRLCSKAWLKQPNTTNMLEEFEIWFEQFKKK